MMVSPLNILKNLVALSLIVIMAYGGYLLMNLKPPRTKGLSFVGGNYLANEPAKELISRDCGEFVWDEKNRYPKTLFFDGLYSSVTSIFKSKKPSKATVILKKNSKGKLESEWIDCIKKVPYEFIRV